MGSPWRYGCDKVITVCGRYREYQTRCGSTSATGGINQCEDCERRHDALPLPDEDEGDLEWDHRVNGGDE